MATKYEWEITYHEALLETDWAKIEARIQAAEAAMKTKLNDFSLNHGGTPQENHAIEDAMNALNVLKREVVVWRKARRLAGANPVCSVPRRDRGGPNSIHPPSHKSEGENAAMRYHQSHAA